MSPVGVSVCTSAMCLLPPSHPHILLLPLSDSRSILIAPVEHHEWIRLAEKVLLIQLVGTELHGGTILQGGGGA